MLVGTQLEQMTQFRQIGSPSAQMMQQHVANILASRSVVSKAGDCQYEMTLYVLHGRHRPQNAA